MNPRKCARYGFINSDANQIKCVGCNIQVTLKSHLNFTSNEVEAKRMMERIKKAHTADCIFNIANRENTKALPQDEFSMKVFEVEKFVIMQRKLLYLKW